MPRDRLLHNLQLVLSRAVRQRDILSSAGQLYQQGKRGTSSTVYQHTRAISWLLNHCTRQEYFDTNIRLYTSLLLLNSFAMNYFWYLFVCLFLKRFFSHMLSTTVWCKHDYNDSIPWTLYTLFPCNLDLATI